MERASDRKLITQWRQHLKKQPRSGLTIEKYCQREGIVVGTFYAWKRRLKPVESTPAPRQRRLPGNAGRSARSGSKTASGFVQLQLPISSTIEVRFADGTLLSLPPGNLEALSTTLRTLQAAQLGGDIND